MTKLFVLCVTLGVTLGVSLSVTAALARGGGTGSHHSSGGASVAAPGTNSSGTALSSGGHGAKGAPFVSDPAIDREEAKVDKMIKSICRGC
jgi:hypothetical protein